MNRKLLALCTAAALALGGALWIGPPRPAVAQNVPENCSSTAIYDASTNGATLLITGQTTRTVFVCGYTLWGGGTSTVQLVTGTGVACATSRVALTPAFALTAQTGIQDSSPVPRGIRANAGLDLCLVTTAGVAIQAIVFYRQQ